MTPVVAALDVGGTKVHGALVDADMSVVTEEISPSGRTTGLGAAAATLRTLLTRAADHGHPVVAVGAGFPEYVDPSGRLTSTEVLAWTEQPATALAEAAPGVPVVIDSDVRCAALGELRQGHGRTDFLYVSLGTGLSSTLVSDGEVRRGARGEAIGLGEFAVVPDADPRWTGNLEQFSSGAGVSRRYALATGTGTHDGGAAGVVERAAAGDEVAVEVLRTAGLAVGAALAQVVALLDPAAIVLGGGLGASSTPLSQAARQELDRRARRRPHPPPMLISTLGASAGLWGAAAVALSARTVPA